jgi:predicted DNA-binding transcriptional regulator YafY
MRKMERLFEIVQILTLASRPLTAAQIGERLEVTPRTVYRDIAALQAMRVPVEGARGLGYILRPGFLLPPMMFTIEEIEAIIVALGLLDVRGDGGLRRAAETVLEKIASAVPPPLRRRLSEPALHVWGSRAATEGLDLEDARHAIRDEQKIAIRYVDAEGEVTERRIRPIALVYYAETANLVAWCELRGDIRHFRPDRVLASATLPDHFRGQGDALRRLWADGWDVDLDLPPEAFA